MPHGEIDTNVFMPSPVTVKIKVPPYLKKYIIAQSVNKAEPVQFDRKHIYAISLILKTSNYNYLQYIPLKERCNVYEYFYHPKNQSPTFEYIDIRLPYNDRKDVRSFNYLGLHNKYRFISEVKEDFYFEMTRVMIKKMRTNASRKEALEHFLKTYNITEDDIKFESLYRQSSRILEPFYQ
jgi:hypothetical protein